MFTTYQTSNSPTSRASQRAEIARQVQQFLDGGGKIESLPPPTSRTSPVASAWQFSLERPQF
jgi:hypothetical protein